MSLQFPLTSGVDGWYPGDETCLVCGTSLAHPPERIRLFVGVTGPSSASAGAFFDCHWYGAQYPGRQNEGLRTVHVFPDDDDTEEKVLEFCSTACLAQFFEAIVQGLE